MLSTSVNLLERVRHRTDEVAWDRFVRLYTPFLHYCCQRVGFSELDAADVVQDVFVVLLNKLPSFQYAKDGSFRGWLQTITINKCRQRFRKRSETGRGGSATWLNRLADENLSLFEETEYRQYIVARAIEIMQADFEPTTWQACWQTLVENRPVAEVAAELSMTVNAVYLARSRVLRHLRAELAPFLDE